LETPDIFMLAKEAEKILAGQEQYRRSARLRAESNFGLEQMTDSYLKVLLG
jgi:hypothetical protein